MNVKLEPAHLSEAKRRLLQHYVGGDLRSDTPQIATLSPGNVEAAKEKTQFPRLRELTLDDYPQVAALESRQGLGLKSYERWSHIWLNNPAYHDLRGQWTIGWILENDKKEIVGAHENIPLLYDFRGKRIVTAQGRGWVIDPSYRAYSLWLLMSFFEQKKVELYFDTTAGIEAERADKELGALRVPVGQWDRDVFWITNYPAMLSSWMRRRMPKAISPIAKPLAYVLSPAVLLRERLTQPPLQTCREGYVFEYRAGFDDRFDEFWSQLRSGNPNTLLAVRTQKVLKWHFAYALRENRLWILTTTKDSRLVAYAIFMKTQDAASGATQVMLVDFQTLTGDSTILQQMVATALERCRKEGVHCLENPGRSFDDSGINKAAPYQRQVSSWRYFYKARNRELQEALSISDVWAPSLYDGDASIL